MKIIIGFSTSNMLFSKIIRFFTRSEVSHTYIRTYDKYLDTSLVIHVERTVCIVRSEEFDKENIIIEEFELEDKRLKGAIKNNLEHLGKKFSWKDWFTWLPGLRRWFKRKLKNPTNSVKRLICVDFILRVLSDANIMHLPIGIMNPKMLKQYCEYYYKKLGWRKIGENENEKIQNNP